MENCIGCDKTEKEIKTEGMEVRWILAEKELICDDCWDQLGVDLGDKGLALAEYLEISPYELDADGDEFTVSPGRSKSGMSPAGAARRVALVKERIEPLRDKSWQQIHEEGWTYKALNGYLKTVDSQNTVYFLLDVANDWINRVIKAAWNGEDIKDERPSYPTNAGVYLVLTDDEADERAKDSIKNYIDDCVLPEVPENMRSYFDEDRFISDAMQDGRGHHLATYDSDENEVMSDNGEYYSIYRTN